MSDGLQTIEEIETEYPNQWILLVDCEVDEFNTRVKRGRVVAYGKKRDVYKASQNYKGKISIRYTGKIPEDIGVMF